MSSFTSHPRARPGARSSKGPLIIIAVVLALLAALGLTGIAITALGTYAFIGFGVRSDLDGYGQHIRASNLGARQKRHFTDRLDAMRRATGGKRVGLMRWVDHDNAVRAIVDDDIITPVEAIELDRQFRNIERDLGLRK